MSHLASQPRSRRLRRFLQWGALAIMLLVGLGFYLTRDLRAFYKQACFLGQIVMASEEMGMGLPVVDEVEILTLGDARPPDSPDFGHGPDFEPDVTPPVAMLESRTIKGAEAESIAALWRGIYFRPHRIRCFSPVYTLRFRHQGKLIFETSVCWHCHGYTLPVGRHGTIINGFDAGSEKAQKLLALLTELAPHPLEKE